MRAASSVSIIERHEKQRSREKVKQKEWYDAHRSIRITKDAHALLIRYAGKLQEERGTVVSPSDALIELVRIACDIGGYSRPDIEMMA